MKKKLPIGIKDFNLNIDKNHTVTCIYELEGKYLEVTAVLAMLRYSEMENYKYIILNFEGKKLLKITKDY